MRFHRRCGDRVTLLNDNSTAVRNFVEFNHGLILSGEPLRDDVMFEVCIDRKVNVWNGSLEIGVTTLDPDYMDLPATATKLRNTAWIDKVHQFEQLSPRNDVSKTNIKKIMSGSSIVKDGVTIVNSYGPELDSLHEGDCLGVMRTNKGDLIFYINGRSLGVAAKELPARLFALIDLYGQCVQVSIINTFNMRPIIESSLDQIEAGPNNDESLTNSEMELAALPPETSYPVDTRDIYVPMSADTACALVARDRLRFHPRSGILVKLSINNKAAERARPLDDYNNGVVMTHRPLYDNELFEIRIDRLVDKWSGSIEVGVTTHNPATIRFPSTMTNMDSGTIMMSGCKVLLNGHGTCMEYGNFNLDELREGETVGMMRKSNGQLHYYINGIDQGVAADKVEPQVWGVVDLYGMTVKVTIVDPCEDVDSNINNVALMNCLPELPAPSRLRQRIDEDSLLFHTLRDSNVIIINDGKTAHRPNAFEFFNNGVIMTNRTLRTNELFQVRLDLVIPKWAGSIEIGVTQHSSNEIQFPFKMSNVKSGMWAMTGEDVIRDGTIIIPQYVRNLNRLLEGDTVGVMRRDMGILHFFVNGVDQGPAAFNIPEHVFGIIDLYGRVAQATIVDTYIPPPVYSPESPISSESNATSYPEMCFHRVHGRNARLSRTRLTASRATVYSEFNDAVLFSARPLRECDMFELRIDKMVDCWIGSLEIGVTAIRPDDLDAHGGVGAIAGTATDLNWDTYILSGAAMMKDGECVRSGYPLDLDTLTVGSRVGMMWHADRSLHYYLDGMDMGKAWYVPHLNIYAVVDLYGQCTQVTILQNEERAFNYNGCAPSDNTGLPNTRPLALPAPPYWSFSEYCGENICLLHDFSIARRMLSDPMGALVFSSTHLVLNEIYEIKIMECRLGFAGSLRMGVTDINILNAHINRCFPPSVSYLTHFTAYIDGQYVKYTKAGSREHDTRAFVPSFEWLRPGDRLGLKKISDGRVLVYYNSELLDIALEKVPDKVYVVMEIYGNVTRIQTISRGNSANLIGPPTIPNVPIAQKNHQNIKLTQNRNHNQTRNYQLCNTLETPNPESAEVEPMQPAKTEAIVTNTEEANSDEIPAAIENIVTTTVTVPVTETRQKKRPLPYTYHYVHGKNIKLCSSDTVAIRTSGYKDGLTIISQPLRRGHNFRFRVDKINDDWLGSLSIGAVCSLPLEPLPATAMLIEAPVWAVSSEALNDNGTFTRTEIASVLEEIEEQCMLTIHFRYNSELLIDIDGKVAGAIGLVPRNYGHVFPLIDLYGRVCQVSVLLHPYKVVNGTSLDLPIIDENLREESLAELEFGEDECQSIELPEESFSPEPQDKRKTRAYSYRSVIEDEDFQAQPGPSSYPDLIPPPHLPVDDELPSKDIKCRKNYPTRSTIHHSFILSDDSFSADNDEMVNHCIQKSHSTHSFRQVPDENSLENEIKETLRHTFSMDARVSEINGEALLLEQFCDTNIRHNDRYPEASDVDNLDNEIMDALTMETGNLPDLTEEQLSSIDESMRREDVWTGTLTMENLIYLNRIMCLDQEGGEGNSLESEWEASGEGCEHLHLVLKYWNFLVLPYPELRQAVSWGQVRCYCINCEPNAQPPLAGWVRIERIDGVGAATRAFWHVCRATLGAAQAGGSMASATHLSGGVEMEWGAPRRPRILDAEPDCGSIARDIWFDEEGKPHHTVLAVEIDVEGSDAHNDRLLAFLIYLKPHVVYIDDNPPSFED